MKLRKLKLLNEVRDRIKRLRRIEYRIERYRVTDQDIEDLEEFFSIKFTANTLDLLLMSIEDGICIDNWSMNKIRNVARKLNIRGYKQMLKDDLLTHIRNKEPLLFLGKENYERGESTNESY